MNRRSAAIAAVAVCAGAWAWFAFRPGPEARIERRLQALAAEFNESTTDGLGTVARAARIGSYFTDDVVVDLGQGTPPIQGRETVIGMTARLQPRTAALRLELVDITVALRSHDRADVSLTATFGRRAIGVESAESVDARELAITMMETGGEWRVSHVRVVDAFR